jgi:hypothetical protein
MRVSLQICLALAFFIPRLHLNRHCTIHERIDVSRTLSAKRVLEVSADGLTSSSAEAAGNLSFGPAPIETVTDANRTKQAFPFLRRASTRAILPGAPIRRVPDNFWRPPPALA